MGDERKPGQLSRWEIERRLALEKSIKDQKAKKEYLKYPSLSSYRPKKGDQERMNAIRDAYRAEENKPLNRVASSKLLANTMSNIVEPMAVIDGGLGAGQLLKSGLRGLMKKELPHSEQITREFIDWADGVDRVQNPLFDRAAARRYENYYDNIGYQAPATGDLAPRLRGSHPQAKIDDMLKKLPPEDSFNYVNYGEKGIKGQGYAVDPLYPEDKIDAGKIVSKWFNENKVDRAHRVGVFLDLPKNALGGEVGKQKNPYTKRDLYNYLFPKEEETTDIVPPTAPSVEEVEQPKEEIDDGALAMAMSMGINPYQENRKTVSEQADDVNPYAQETRNEILSSMKGVRDLGIWGDISHQRRKSDHNTGDAWDAGIDAPEIGETLVKKLQKEAKEKNIKYIIYNGKIWNPSVSDEWRPYTGPDKHTEHAHISYNR